MWHSFKHLFLWKMLFVIYFDHKVNTSLLHFNVAYSCQYSREKNDIKQNIFSPLFWYIQLKLIFILVLIIFSYNKTALSFFFQSIQLGIIPNIKQRKISVCNRSTGLLITQSNVVLITPSSSFIEGKP